MKKITLMLLFCFCAVGLSQAQQTGEDGSIAASYNTENVSGPISLTYLGLDRNLVINSQNQTRLVSDSDYTFDSSSMPYQMGVNNAYVAPSDRQALVFNNPIRSTCNEENPSNGFENGVFSSPGGGSPQQSLAADITVPADTDFSLTTINANILLQGVFANGDMITSVDITVFGDDGTGKPDPANIIADFPGTVPDSQLYLATVFTSYDILDTTFELPATLLEGQAGATTTYWIRLYVTNSNGNTAGWESTTATSNGNLMAFSLDFGVTWNVDAAQDLVYDFIGDCTPLGGGGTACNEENPSNGFENGVFSSPGGGSPQQSLAADITVPADTDFSLTTINANILIQGVFANGDMITSVDITVFGDDGTGKPDPANIIADFPGTVPDSQLYLATVFTSYDILDTTFELPATLLEGQAGATTTYWIRLYVTNSNGNTAGWESTTATSNGNLMAFSLDFGVTWNVDAAQDLVYDFIGECSPIGGPPADNDTCGTAFTVECGDTVVSDTLTNTDTGGNAAPDEWYSFTGTGSAEFVTISLCDGGTDYDSTLRVFSDCTLTNEIVDNDDFCGVQSELEFESDGTSTYYIMVEGWSTSSGNFSLAVSCIPVPQGPPNDLVENAISMSCGDIVAGTTILATEDSAVAPTCDTSVTAPGVWYVYDDTSGLVTDITITMCNGATGYDSKLSVYTGDITAPPLTCVTGNDDTCGLQSEVSFQSDGATTYYILVHGFGSGEGNFEIEMICELVPPPNDMIANSIDVDEVGFPYTDPSVVTLAATLEAGSPVGCDNAGARGVWYNFVAAADGTATATIVSPGFTAGTPDVSMGLGAAPTNVTMGLGASGDLSFTVNNGPLVGSYDAIAAAFGGEFTADLITGDTVLMIDDDTTGDPNDACDPLLNGGSLSGKIAIARRGACAFTDKVISAQNEGAIAVIVINNQGAPIVMGGDNPDITIPALMIGEADGEALLASFDTFLGLTVTSGGLAGSYEVIAAAFGGEFTSTLITGSTVLMIDDDTTGDPNDACDPLVNGGSLSGKIAIARRGACAFTDKVISAQNAGAIAVIVINNQGAPIVMGGANPDITIPALMIGTEDGEALLNSNLGFNTVTFYTAPNENAVETDLELVDWYQNQCLPGVTATIPTVAGQAYYVFVANHDGVTDIVIDGTNLGTEDNNTIEGFVYYPNPTQSTLNLRAQDNIESAVIYNMLGQKVFDQNVNATTSELNVSDLATGAYILQVSVNGQIGTYQILKK